MVLVQTSYIRIFYILLLMGGCTRIPYGVLDKLQPSIFSRRRI